MTEVTGSTLLGSPGFVEQMRSWLDGKLPDRDVPAAKQLRPAISIEAIVDALLQIVSALQ